MHNGYVSHAKYSTTNKQDGEMIQVSSISLF